MNGEPDTTLAWAEFLWTVTKEAPEVVFAYLLLLDYLRRRSRTEKECRHLVLELHDSVAVTDSGSFAIGPV